LRINYFSCLTPENGFGLTTISLNCPNAKMNSLKQVIVTAVIKVSEDPKYGSREYATSEEARRDFIKALIAELFPECPDCVLPEDVQSPAVVVAEADGGGEPVKEKKKRAPKKKAEAPAAPVVAEVAAVEAPAAVAEAAPVKEKKKRAPKKKEEAPQLRELRSLLRSLLRRLLRSLRRRRRSPVASPRQRHLRPLRQESQSRRRSREASTRQRELKISRNGIRR